jgi:hypothetical protein
MIGFCPDGYVSSQEAVLRAAQFWFPEKVASLDTVVLENVNKESVRTLSYPQLPEELRKLFEGIAGQTVPRLRNFLHQGKLKAYYFENDGCRTVSRKFWATAQADGVAIRKLEQFKSYRITDSLFREAENASGKREPGVKRRQDD